MDFWFNAIVAGRALPREALRELHKHGYTVLPGVVASEQLNNLASAYDAAIASADPRDVKTGSATTRVNGFVNCGPAFDAVYVLPPLLEACGHIIGGPFKLSSMHARTVRPYAQAQDLHVDVQRDSADWPLVGFILMVDAFRPDNGATRFVPGSHAWSAATETCALPSARDRAKEVVACGAAGSLIIFNGSTLHGHGANASDELRRSLQGALIPREGHAATDFRVHMEAKSLARLDPLARYVLALTV
jgi:hypothetical protein